MSWDQRGAQQSRTPDMRARRGPTPLAPTAVAGPGRKAWGGLRAQRFEVPLDGGRRDARLAPNDNKVPGDATSRASRWVQVSSYASVRRA